MSFALDLQALTVLMLGDVVPILTAFLIAVLLVVAVVAAIVRYLQSASE